MRVLDTDIGTDVDDLIALVVSWGGELEFDAITTVYGDTALRAEIVRDAYARGRREHPPVWAGNENPLSGRPVFWAGHEGEALPARTAPLPAPDPRSVTAALRSADEVLAIGPLTNLALALRPRASSPAPTARRIVVMGGDFSGVAEHNVICDVDAAAEVFRAGVPIDVIGTDQTERVRIDRRAIDALPETAVGALLREETGRFRRFMEAEDNAPHDALAVLLLERPERFALRRGHVVVETAPERAGQVRFEPDSEGPHRVVVDVDVTALRDDIIARMHRGAAG